MHTGAMVSGRPVIVADLVDIHHVSAAFALTVFCQGIGVMLGPIVAGKRLINQ